MSQRDIGENDCLYTTCPRDSVAITERGEKKKKKRENKIFGARFATIGRIGNTVQKWQAKNLKKKKMREKEIAVMV